MQTLQKTHIPKMAEINKTGIKPQAEKVRKY